MLNFSLHLGGLDESQKFLEALKLITLAESLGGYESLAELPYLMTHASIEEKEVRKFYNKIGCHLQYTQL